MKRPVAPKQPSKPYKPTEPPETVSGRKLVLRLPLIRYDDYTLGSLAALLQPTADALCCRVGDLKLQFHDDYDEWSGSNLEIEVFSEGVNNNPNYDTQYADYLKKLAKYEADLEKFKAKDKQYKAALKEYQQKFKEWQLENAKETVKKLEKELG